MCVYVLADVSEVDCVGGRMVRQGHDVRLIGIRLHDCVDLSVCGTPQAVHLDGVHIREQQESFWGCAGNEYMCLIYAYLKKVFFSNCTLFCIARSVFY